MQILNEHKQKEYDSMFGQIVYLKYIIPDFHRQAKCHARRTQKSPEQMIAQGPFVFNLE